MQAELIFDAKAELGEGPLWDDQNNVLYWVDILGQTLNRYTPATQQNETFTVGQDVGTVILDTKGDILLAVRDGFARFDTQTEQLTMLASPENHLPEIRFNDGKASPAGNFWAGTMAYDVTPYVANLYSLDGHHNVKKHESDLTISNGIVWTSDHKTMYLIDSPPRVVTAYDYNKETDTISNGRIVIKVPEHMGFPDGMAIDEKGQLWIAHWGYGAIVCWCPKTGEVMQEIKVPVMNPSACAFGGDDMQTLYITSAYQGLSEEDRANYPLSGGLFAIKLDVKGQASYRYQTLD